MHLEERTLTNLLQWLTSFWKLHQTCMSSVSVLVLCACAVSPLQSFHAVAIELKQQALKPYFKVTFRPLLQEEMYKPVRTYPFHLWGSPLCHQITSESRGTQCNLHRASSLWCICSTSHPASSISSFQFSPAGFHPGPLPHWCHMSPPWITPYVRFECIYSKKTHIVVFL